MKYTLKHFGWAEGTYLNKCISCGKHFNGDKRGVICKNCVVDELLKQYNMACNKLEKLGF